MTTTSSTTTSSSSSSISSAVCVHCSTPTKELVLSYGPDHVVCTRCDKCGQFADPYVEEEGVIVAIDLILVKPKAYRHLLFNRPLFQIPQWKKDKDKKLDDDDENCNENKTDSSKGVHGRKKVEKEYSSSATNHSSSTARTTTSKLTPTSRGQIWFALFYRLSALLLLDTYLRWTYICASDGEKDKRARLLPPPPPSSSSSPSSYRTLSYQSLAIRSFLRVLMATSMQMGTLFLTTLVLSMLYCRILRFLFVKRKSTSDSISKLKDDLNRFRPHLVLTSLLFAHITPAFLLTLLLLWHTHSTPSPTSNGWQWDEDSIAWAIRSLVGGLSSGVALGVILPLQKSAIGALIAISILLTAWTLQLQVSTWLQLPFHSGIGVLHTSVGSSASQLYCT